MLSNSNLKFDSNIHALRAIAIISVIFFHFYPKYMPNGYLGVDVFFSISGFLIGQVIYTLELKKLADVTIFLKSRLYRIFPPLFITILFSIFAAQTLYPVLDYDIFIKSVIPSLLFYSNFYLSETVNYFNNDIFNIPLAHVWSLSVEGQFYLISALIVFLLRDKKIIFVTFTILSLISFIILIYSLGEFTEKYFLPYSRFWQFGIPFIFGFLWSENSITFKKILVFKYKKIISLFATISLILILFFPFKIYSSELLRIFIFFFTFSIILVKKNYHFLYQIQNISIVKITGNISYSLYLYHFPIIVFYRIKYLETPGEAISILLIFCASITAFFSWKYLELPILNSKNKIGLAQNKYCLFGAAVSIIFIVYTVINSRSMIHANYDYKKTALDWGFSQYCTSANLKNEKCQNSNNPEVLIYGDSYGRHISSLYKNSGYKIRQVIKDGCRLAIDEIWSKTEPMEACNKWNREVLNNLIKQPNSIKEVVIASNFNFDGIFVFKNGQLIEINPSLSVEITNNLIEIIRSSKKKITIIIPAITSNKDIGLCLRKESENDKIFDNCNIDKNSISVNQKFVREILRNSKADHLVNIQSMLFENDYYLSHIRKCPIYWDGGHWTTDGTNCFLKYFGKEFLKKNKISK